MREIILYGPMRTMFGRSFKMDVRSVGEAFKALNATIPGFRKWFNDTARAGAKYKILVGKRGVSTGELTLQSDRQAPIRIVPVIEGSKNNKLLGAVVAIVGAVVMWYTGNPYVFQLGLGMVIGGVALMMVPTPKTPSPNESSANKPSQLFDGPVNATNPGNCLPVLYGVMEVGSVVASAAIYTEDISPVLTSQVDPDDYPSRDPYDTFTKWNP
jgi:predicted phage tail protein